eukprot:m.1171186 g.1171186  ORF g.1171186 m.1171186 type:complete len:779 (+) comp24512_c0_seq6:118-2454(+)
MRFLITTPKKRQHSATASAVGFTNKNKQLWSYGDDRSLLKWDNGFEQTERAAELPADVYPTDLHWYPRRGGGGDGGGSASRNSSADLAAVACTDGKFRLVSGAGRTEKTVDAHRGAITSLRWSPDGSALATVGEDGQIKIWSKTGMLRATLAQGGMAVYSVAWSPAADKVLYPVGGQLVVKPLQPSSKTEQWKAHDGVILCTDWNVVNNRIISGGEDRKYKVWDSYGRVLYSSAAHDHPITSVRWAPSGEFFAAASFALVRLCDAAGWSHCLHRLDGSGSVYALAWTSECDQLALGCATGDVVLARVIGHKRQWMHFEICVETLDTISVSNILTGSVETLSDFREPVLKVSIAYGHLIVTTSSQALVYATTNWHTPVVIDLKDGLVSHIKQSPKQFALVDSVLGVLVYTYEGRLVSSPKVANCKADLLTAQTVAISDDTMAQIDQRDPKKVHIIDIASGQPIGKPIQHTIDVVEVALDQASGGLARHLTLVDKNRDLHVATVRRSTQTMAKLGTMVESMMWHDTWSILAALSNGKLSVWYIPSVVFIDPDIVAQTRADQDAGAFGASAAIESFVGNQCAIRRADGAVMPTGVSPYPAVLHAHASARKWDDAIRLCRFVKENTLWACLAALAAAAKELNAAEVAYAAIEAVDKVQYLAYIKTIPTVEGRNAEMTLFCHQIDEAEAILLTAGLVYRAINMNCQMFRWERALDLAMKHKTHMDTVIGFREKNLARFGNAHETNRKFLQVSRAVAVDWDKINEKIKAELEAERSRPGAVPYA